MSSIQIIPVEAHHVARLAQICFEAFGGLQDRHGVERDFDSVQTAEQVVGMFASRPDFYGVAAQVDGRIVGSNFISFTDPVSGVGPITVDPRVQTRGIGRALMLAVLDEARRRGVQSIRLQQEAINTVSMSLYTKLGFDWREAGVLMKPAIAPEPAADVRLMTPADLPRVQEISSSQYGSTRHNEVAHLLAMSMPAMVLQRRGAVCGYYVASFLGHGFAETPEDLAHLITQAQRYTPPQFQKVLVPLSENVLHRHLLERGGKTVKLFNYMTFGQWTAPTGAWVPSIGM